MAQSDLSSSLVSIKFLDMSFNTSGGGAVSLNTGAIDTINAEAVNIFAGITAVTPTNPNTYNISIGYTITESDTAGGSFSVVPIEKFIFRDSESPITQVYSGGGTQGQENFTLKEIGLVGTKRFLKIALTQSSSTTGDVQLADFGLFMMNNSNVKPI